jgi:pimeloyl-ACP methyl ester carboxylesterase
MILQDDGTLLLFQPAELLFSDLGAMEKQHWCDHLVPFTAKIEDIVISAPDPVWKQVPIVYIVCDEDLLIPENLQRVGINAGRHSGAIIEEVSIEGCGHTPNLGAPNSIFDVLQAAANKLGRAEESQPQSSRSNSVIAQEES